MWLNHGTLLQEWLLYESCEIGQFLVNVTIESESSEVIRRHISISDVEVGELFMFLRELHIIFFSHRSVSLHLLFSTIID